MPRITVGTENSTNIELHYNDHGAGKPIVLIHGYPLDGNSWERQERVLLAQGYRCISYDRRGFGHSSQPAAGYDYDTFAADLRSLLDHLALEQDVALAGFSMGTGEVTRYLGTYGSAGISKAVLIGAIPPYLLQADDNPQGVPRMSSRVSSTRSSPTATPSWTRSWPTSTTPTCAHRAAQRRSPARELPVAAGAGPYATYACVDTWLTDFRGDLPKIDIPVLAVHGSADRVLPFEVTAKRLPGTRRGPEARHGGWRATQHRLDPSRGGQPGAARLHRRLGPPERSLRCLVQGYRFRDAGRNGGALTSRSDESHDAEQRMLGAIAGRARARAWPGPERRLLSARVPPSCRRVGCRAQRRPRCSSARASRSTAFARSS